MILEETRENIKIEWGDYTIDISHDFYSVKYEHIDYEQLYELTGTILLLCEGNIESTDKTRNKRKFTYQPTLWRLK